MSAHLLTWLERPLRPRILLVGDVMLDRYQWGDVERISPEAPIPVLRVSKQEHRLGGAGSVAAMLCALDADVTLATVVGQDAEAQTVRGLLDKLGVHCGCMLSDPQRCTTVKERFLGRTQQRHPHHMMRVDREIDAPISAAERQRLLDRLASQLQHADLVVVSDYNKGVCAGEMIPRLIAAAAEHGVRVLADPIKGSDYRRYRGAWCITPNRVEAGLATGTRIVTPQDGLAAARKLVALGIQSVLVTLDRDGMAWADEHGHAELFPCRPREVYDITGAGDMVLSTLAVSSALGADFASAVEIANTAGGLEVERLGVVPISRAEIIAELSRASGTTRHKIMPLGSLLAELGRQRQAGRRVVMTNGCFDLLHPGHVASLQEARRQGDCLVVGLNSDHSVRQLKGPRRPIVDERGRAEMLAALACVDYVVLFDEVSVAGLVEQVRPDVLVKAAQYDVPNIVGSDIVLAYGGQVVPVPMQDGYSTTDLIARIRALDDEDRRKRSAA